MRNHSLLIPLRPWKTLSTNFLRTSTQVQKLQRWTSVQILKSFSFKKGRNALSFSYEGMELYSYKSLGIMYVHLKQALFLPKVVNIKLIIKMAKVPVLKIKQENFNGIMANQEFATLRIQNQLGDRFFIPKSEMLLIVGSSIPALDRNGNTIKDEKGNETYRSVGQHFPAVRIVDGEPTEVVELYVGQLVKLDIKRKLVFSGILSDSLRKSSDDFKKAICGKVLEITEETECDDRVWDANNARWMRDPEDDMKFVSQKKRVFKFEPKASTLNAADTDEAYKMLERYITEMYSEIAETVEK